MSSKLWVNLITNLTKTQRKPSVFGKKDAFVVLLNVFLVMEIIFLEKPIRILSKCFIFFFYVPLETVQIICINFKNVLIGRKNLILKKF